MKIKEKIISKLYPYFYSSDLSRLGRFYGTDKVNGHYYTQHYQSHFKNLRKKHLNLLEIGVGGEEDVFKGGNSLRMWKRYFPKGNIFSIDIFDKSFHEEKRIKIFKGDQSNVSFLNDISKYIGDIDIIIDDGSHINNNVINTFEILFPKLKDGGIYIVEDTQTSYWPKYGGSSIDLSSSITIMNFFKGLTDSLNNKEFILDDYVQNYYDKKIISIHFYHNLIFIYKGDNNEESNIIVNNRIFDN